MTPAGIVLDLDGVLLAAGAPIPGAVDAVRSLQRAGHPCAVLTNMTSALPQDISARLAEAGIDLAAERIVTAAVATAECAARRRIPARACCSSPSEGASASSPASSSSRRPPADLVVVGGPDECWTLTLLDRALRALQGGARLIAMQGNAWWLAADGARLDSGVYVRALALRRGHPPACDRQARVRDLPRSLPGARPAARRVPDGRRRPSLGRAGGRAGGPARGARPHRQGPWLRRRSARLPGRRDSRQRRRRSALAGEGSRTLGGA